MEALAQEARCQKFNLATSIDVKYQDLQLDPAQERKLNGVGMSMVIGLYFAFTPFIIGVSAIANLRTLRSVEAIDNYFAANPGMAITVQGVLATAALQIFLMFYPTLVMNIFDTYYCLKSATWCQVKIQEFYYWFLMFFVVFVTALGDSFLLQVKSIIASPGYIFVLFATTMPMATHYYMNFIALQPFTDMVVLLRHKCLLKYHAFKALYGPEKGKAMSEPEGQDFFGIGARSARFTITLSIGIIYGTLAPLIFILTAVYFWCTRMIYGYLLVFAETKKADLGGVFFVNKLRHTLISTCFYCVLMVGVLGERAASVGPMCIACVALAVSVIGLQKFDKAYRWQTLPILQLGTNLKYDVDPNAPTKYVQEDLYPKED
jgi:hypothetical protein